MEIAPDVYLFECRDEKQFVSVPVYRNVTSKGNSMNMLMFDALSLSSFLFTSAVGCDV